MILSMSCRYLQKYQTHAHATHTPHKHTYQTDTGRYTCHTHHIHIIQTYLQTHTPDTHTTYTNIPLMPMASSMESVHLKFGVLFLLPSVFPASLSFPKNLPSHDGPEVGQLRFCHLASGDVSGFLWSRTHLSAFLVVQGIHRAHLQPCVSNGSVFTVSLLHWPAVSVGV